MKSLFIRAIYMEVLAIAFFMIRQKRYGVFIDMTVFLMYNVIK